MIKDYCKNNLIKNIIVDVITSEFFYGIAEKDSNINLYGKFTSLLCENFYKTFCKTLLYEFNFLEVNLVTIKFKNGNWLSNFSVNKNEETPYIIIVNKYLEHRYSGTKEKFNGPIPIILSYLSGNETKEYQNISVYHDKKKKIEVEFWVRDKNLLSDSLRKEIFNVIEDSIQRIEDLSFWYNQLFKNSCIYYKTEEPLRYDPTNDFSIINYEMDRILNVCISLLFTFSNGKNAKKEYHLHEKEIKDAFIRGFILRYFPNDSLETSRVKYMLSPIQVKLIKDQFIKSGRNELETLNIEEIFNKVGFKSKSHFTASNIIASYTCNLSGYENFWQEICKLQNIKIENEDNQLEECEKEIFNKEGNSVYHIPFMDFGDNRFLFALVLDDNCFNPLKKTPESVDNKKLLIDILEDILCIKAETFRVIILENELNTVYQQIDKFPTKYEARGQFLNSNDLKYHVNMLYERDDSSGYPQIKSFKQQSLLKYFQNQINQRIDNKNEYLESKIKKEADIFKINCEKIFKINKLEINNFGFFTDSFAWEFSPNINIILGKNGYGKSYLLRLIAGMLYKDEGIMKQYKPENSFDARINLVLDIENEQENEERVINYSNSSFKEPLVGKIPILAIAESRFIDKSNDAFYLNQRFNNDLITEGARNFLDQTPCSELIQNKIYHLLFETYTEISLEKLKMNPEKKQLEELDERFRGIKEIFNRLTEINFIQFLDVERSEKEGLRLIVETCETNQPLPLQKASQGTLSIISIFLLIYDYLKDIQVVQNIVIKRDPRFTAGIVFIEEIDAHLHPTWQKKIIDLLVDYFPNVQFFISAHNPLVISSCSNDQVSFLSKIANKFGLIKVLRPYNFIDSSSKELFELFFETTDYSEINEKCFFYWKYKKEYEEELQYLEQKEESDPIVIQRIIELKNILAEVTLYEKKRTFTNF